MQRSIVNDTGEFLEIALHVSHRCARHHDVPFAIETCTRSFWSNSGGRHYCSGFFLQSVLACLCQAVERTRGEAPSMVFVGSNGADGVRGLPVRFSSSTR